MLNIILAIVLSTPLASPHESRSSEAPATAALDRHDHHLISRDKAIPLLDQVNGRRKDGLPSEIRTAFLQTKPKYTQNPAREFLDGHTLRFHTNGHPKSKGVNISFSYPMSWTSAEGHLPNVVQRFVSQRGHGTEIATIITKNLPMLAVLTEREKNELFSSIALREMIPEKATLIATRSTQLEGDPAGILEFRVATERLGIRVLSHAWTIVFLSGNTLVQVRFGILGPVGSETELAQRMTKYKPLFHLMANSVVTDRWTDPRHSR